MTVQVSSRRLSYFSCLPNRHTSSFMSILGQGINHSSIHNLPSTKTHTPFSVIHAFNNLLSSQCIYIYIYIIKRARESSKSFFPSLFCSILEPTPLLWLFILSASFTSLWMLDQSLLVMTLSVSGLFQTSQPWSLPTWFVSAARTFTILLAHFSSLLIMSSLG